MGSAREQFEPLGPGYARSKSHAAGRTLALVRDRAQPNPGELACDVGTGTGHTALVLAPRVLRVVGADPAAGMLAEAWKLAYERGIGNARWVRTPAERLPFPRATFDLVVSRTAAHHFSDVAAAAREWARVLRRGGRCVVSDLAGHDDPDLHRFVHEIEVLHDPTHGRSLRGREWKEILEAAGLEVRKIEGGMAERLTELPEGTRVSDWCVRSRTPPDAAAEIVRRLRTAPPAIREALAVREDGADVLFNVYKLVVTARRP